MDSNIPQYGNNGRERQKYWQLSIKNTQMQTVAYLYISNI